MDADRDPDVFVALGEPVELLGVTQGGSPASRKPSTPTLARPIERRVALVHGIDLLDVTVRVDECRSSRSMALPHSGGRR